MIDVSLVIKANFFRKTMFIHNWLVVFSVLRSFSGLKESVKVRSYHPLYTTAMQNCKDSAKDFCEYLDSRLFPRFRDLGNQEYGLVGSKSNRKELDKLVRSKVCSR